MNELEHIRSLVIKGNADDIVQSVQEALAGGIPPDKILNEALTPAMTEVGDKMESGALFIPEVLVAARAMKAATEVLKPLLVSGSAEFPSAGRVVLATVEGDLHDVGKNLVRLMLEGAGFDVIDLGVNVSSERIIEAVKEQAPQIVGLSALLTTTVTRMKDVIEDLKQHNLRECVKVMVGGAAVTQNYGELIGADCYSPDCADAAKKAKALVQLERRSL